MERFVTLQEVYAPPEPLNVFAQLVGRTALSLEHLAIPEQPSVPTLEPIESPPPITPDLEPVTRAERLFAAHVLSGLVEVLDGSRPLKQVEAHLSPQMCLALLGRRFRPNIAGQGYRLRTMHTQKPQEKVIEAWGTAANGQRARAVVSRMQRYPPDSPRTTRTLPVPRW
ncbi:MAG TPA: Rv3235 family protein [Candidatus Saccharimonadales bacterium]|nr:Rv3235 family protein [Candidatus Saccharimonadales bacterium]